MIEELNSVLVPDEEIARIHEYAHARKEARQEREAEREKIQAMLSRTHLY